VRHCTMFGWPTPLTLALSPEAGAEGIFWLVSPARVLVWRVESDWAIQVLLGSRHLPETRTLPFLARANQLNRKAVTNSSGPLNLGLSPWAGERGF